MEINPHLHFNGDCREAFTFYERHLGGRIVFIQTLGESPCRDQIGADWHDKVIHARLDLGGQVLMGCDAPDGRYVKPQGLQVTINVSDLSEAERLFTALSESGTVTMPFQKTFWSPGFGMAVDRFGIPWMVNTAQAA